jgi:hypothetical protein
MTARSARGEDFGEVPGLVPIGTPGQRPADPLLTVAGPPAGTYIVEATVDGSPGRLIAGLDRIPGPLWSWDLTGTRGPWRQSIVLSVPSLALQIDADAAGRRAISALSIRAERLASGPARFDGLEARRAGRYGPGFVFLVDGSAYMEKAGAWVAVETKLGLSSSQRRIDGAPSAAELYRGTL